MDTIRHLMQKNLINTYRGWWAWHCVVRKYHIGATAVILMPGTNRQYNRSALLFLDQMLKQRKYENAVILTVDRAAAASAKLFSENICAVECISRRKAEQFMQFYSLYEFDPRFIVASLDEPYGRNAWRLAGVRGTTVDELMALGVYRLPVFKRPKLPAYSGNHAKILQFLGKERSR